MYGRDFLEEDVPDVEITHPLINPRDSLEIDGGVKQDARPNKGQAQAVDVLHHTRPMRRRGGEAKAASKPKGKSPVMHGRRRLSHHTRIPEPPLDREIYAAPSSLPPRHREVTLSRRLPTGTGVDTISSEERELMKSLARLDTKLVLYRTSKEVQEGNYNTGRVQQGAMRMLSSHTALNVS